jgi:hypothetical protein
MTNNRILSVNEARVGLSLLTALLVTLGYVVVRRLGDSPRAEPIAPSTTSTFSDSSVRTALGIAPGERAEHQTSYAPQWLEVQSEPSDSSSRTITR